MKKYLILILIISNIFAQGDITDDTIVSIQSTIEAESGYDLDYLFDNNINTSFSTKSTEKVDPFCTITVELEKEHTIKGIGFVSSNDKIERDPKLVNIYGSNDNSTWHLIGELDIDGFNWPRSTMQEFLLPNEQAYKYFQLEIDNQDIENGLFGDIDRLCIAEIELYNEVHYMKDVNDLSRVIVTAQYPGQDVYDEVETNLIDNNFSTQYVTGQSIDSTCWVQFDTPIDNCLKKVILYSGNGKSDRDPKSLIVEALSGDNWVRLGSIYIEQEWERIEGKEFDLENDESYSSYRLIMTNSETEGLFGNERRIQLSEIELYATKLPPVADFKSNLVINKIESGSSVNFINLSADAVDISWEFEGGTPTTSNEMNPQVQYTTTGEFDVTLTVSNQYGSSSITKENYITVKEDYPWGNFNFPEVVVSNLAGEHEGVKLYTRLCQDNGFNGIEDFVQSCCLLMAYKIYYTVEEANAHNVQKITYKLNDGGALSYKGGSPPNVEVGFDVNYIVNFYNNHSADAAVQEVLGVLCHELTHAYQKSPRNAGGYRAGDEYYGFIEGMADLGRLLTGGFNPERYPSRGGHWNDGYNTTAFWYLWIQRTQEPLNALFEKEDFIKELNLTAQNMSTWSHEKMCQELYGKSATTLWSQYQSETGKYPWTDDVAINDNFSSNSQYFKLHQNYPNPFNPITKITYQIPNSSNVKILVFDMKGNQVDILVDQYMASGIHSINWYAFTFSSGLYFYKIIVNEFVDVKKMILLK